MPTVTLRIRLLAKGTVKASGPVRGTHMRRVVVILE